MKEELISVVVITLLLAIILTFLGPAYLYGAELVFNGEDDLSDKTWPMEEMHAMGIFIFLSLAILAVCGALLSLLLDYNLI